MKLPKIKLAKPRNPAARSPLMRKGGPHERAKSGERQQDQKELDKALNEWKKESEKKIG